MFGARLLEPCLLVFVTLMPSSHARAVRSNIDYYDSRMYNDYGNADYYRPRERDLLQSNDLSAMLRDDVKPYQETQVHEDWDNDKDPPVLVESKHYVTKGYLSFPGRPHPEPADVLHGLSFDYRPWVLLLLLIFVLLLTFFALKQRKDVKLLYTKLPSGGDGVYSVSKPSQRPSPGELSRKHYQGTKLGPYGPVGTTTTAISFISGKTDLASGECATGCPCTNPDAKNSSNAQLVAQGRRAEKYKKRAETRSKERARNVEEIPTPKSPTRSLKKAQILTTSPSQPSPIDRYRSGSPRSDRDTNMTSTV